MRILLLILILSIFLPLKCYGLTGETKAAKRLQGQIDLVTVKYEGEISDLDMKLTELQNSRRISYSPEETSKTETNPKATSSNPEELQKKIQELEQKLDQTTKQYETQLDELKTSLEELKKQQQDMNDKMQQTLQAPQASTVEVPVATPAPIQAQQNQNPDTSVVGDFVVSNDHPPNDNKAFLRETELGFQAVVDPYARANFVISGDPTAGFDVEEGYVTLLTLPGGLQAKLGKFKADFGKVNKLHRHDYYMSTYPNVIRNFLGDEGFSEPGLNLSVILPMENYVEFTGEVFTGGNNLSFADHNNYVYLGHGRTFFDLNESNSIELGGTYAEGRHDPENRLNTKLIGLDFTYRWDPTDQEEHSLLFQSEVLFSRQDQLKSSDTLNSMGYYAFLQYKLARRWLAGVRYDYSEFPGDCANNEKSYSAALSFWPSEFLRFRLQYTHTDRTFGESDNSFYFQTTFVIGPHGAHPF